MRKRILLATPVLGLTLAIVGFLLTKGSPTPVPNPPGSFSFGVLGDAPYYPWEKRQWDIQLRSIDEHDLTYVLHVGDIFWRPCSDEIYADRYASLAALRHPVMYTPGDNDWADCWEPESGSHAPLERLARLRQVFYPDPSRSGGRNPIPVVSQAENPQFAEFVENARWERNGLVFATVHLVGSANARESYAGRGADDDAAWRTRTEAAAAWVRSTFQRAAQIEAGAVVLACHADLPFTLGAEEPLRQCFEPFLTTLEQEVERFGKRVLLVHGDDHKYVVDQPLLSTTGGMLANLTRMQVPGSPHVGWVRVMVTPGDLVTFTFEDRILPRWKYW